MGLFLILTPLAWRRIIRGPLYLHPEQKTDRRSFVGRHSEVGGDAMLGSAHRDLKRQSAIPRCHEIAEDGRLSFSITFLISLAISIASVTPRGR